MHPKIKKQAIVAVIGGGIVLVITGIVIQSANLLNIYGLAGNSTNCNASCTAKLNHDSLIFHVGIGAYCVGFALIVVGIIFLIANHKKKNPQA
jgi:hypothetical protein